MLTSIMQFLLISSIVTRVSFLINTSFSRIGISTEYSQHCLSIRLVWSYESYESYESYGSND